MVKLAAFFNQRVNTNFTIPMFSTVNYLKM